MEQPVAATPRLRRVLIVNTQCVTKTVMCAYAGAAETDGAASGGDPVAFALGMTGCNKRELHSGTLNT
jgi:hypothetical protein